MGPQVSISHRSAKSIWERTVHCVALFHALKACRILGAPQQFPQNCENSNFLSFPNSPQDTKNYSSLKSHCRGEADAVSIQV